MAGASGRYITATMHAAVPPSVNSTVLTDHTHARAEPAAHELAGRAADENECKSRSQQLRRDPLCVEQERQEGEESHAYGRIEHADGKQRGESACSGAAALSGRSYLGCR
ncbi:hypothetical protein M3654_23395, partial [Bacillus licheniformis]|nr:hypothetical protein [Bacillus licheniformis]